MRLSGRCHLSALALSLLLPSFGGAADALERSTTRVVPVTEQAARWGLSEREYRSYQALMAGQRGVWSPGLDPLTALGVSTESAEERRRYAELYVHAEFARTQRELAFQVAVNDAWRRLYPAAPRLRALSTAGEGRHALIVRLGSSRAADFVTEHLPGLLAQPGHRLDVHVAGSGGNDEALRAWVAQIPPLAVAMGEGRVTVNHGASFNDRVDLPAIYRRDGSGQWQRVE